MEQSGRVGSHCRPADRDRGDGTRLAPQARCPLGGLGLLCGVEELHDRVVHVGPAQRLKGALVWQCAGHELPRGPLGSFGSQCAAAHRANRATGHGSKVRAEDRGHE